MSLDQQWRTTVEQAEELIRKLQQDDIDFSEAADAVEEQENGLEWLRERLARDDGSTTVLEQDG
ncbi:MAG: hypothetical protein SV186_00545 [Candidatus Nanohaloarchaea archaeon]|nr:hypothetical protein [Candidatus Nanohaloarchaea archaeon]